MTHKNTDRFGSSRGRVVVFKQVQLTREQRAALRRAGGPRGPQRGRQSGLEPGDGVQVRPHVAVQHVGDGGVVDSGDSAGVAEASSGEGFPQVHREESGGLDSRVGAGQDRPVGDQFDRRGASGAGHQASVVKRPVLRVVASALGGRPESNGNSTPSDSVGGNQQQDAGNLVASAIRDYEPDLPGDEWANVADFVRSAVTDCQRETPYSARELLTVSARYVRWCWRTAGLPLDRSVIFQRDSIAEYIARGCEQMSPASAGNRRSQLLRMSEILLPPEERQNRLAPLPPSDPLAPYTPADIVALRSWAKGQNTQYRRAQCHLLLALGLGAGLSNAEILAVRACHIRADNEGAMVEVTGARPRFVPVLATWEQTLIDYAEAMPLDRKQFVFRPRRTSTHANALINFVDKSKPGRVRATAQRMRVTWMVTHLRAGTPVKPLVTAAGVDSLEALTRYLRYVPEADAQTWRQALRTARGGCAT